MTSVSKTAVQTYFCPVQQVCLARQLRLAWFYFDPLGTFAPLAGLHRLISCPTTISSHNHYYSSQVLSARQLSFAIFLRSSAWNAACCMNQITSEWVILNLKASCYLWMSRVTSETHVIFSMAPLNATYLTNLMYRKTTVSHIFTVATSVVFNGLTPTLHVKFCHTFFC